MAEIVPHHPVASTPVVLTEPEVARVLRVSDRTVRRWAAAGTLTAIKVGGVRRFLLRDVAALIDPSTDERPGMRLEIRVTDAFLRRLDAFAQARGLNRSEAIRTAVLEASPAAPGELPLVAERDELRRLLGEAARVGSVSAMRALLDEHRRDAGADGPDPTGGWIDELARRRTSGNAA